MKHDGAREDRIKAFLNCDAPANTALPLDELVYAKRVAAVTDFPEPQMMLKPTSIEEPKEIAPEVEPVEEPEKVEEAKGEPIPEDISPKGFWERLKEEADGLRITIERSKE